MMINESPLDRAVRAAAGLALLASPIVGFSTFPLNFLGVLPLVTGIAGVCPLYSLFGFSSCSKSSYQHLRNIVTRDGGEEHPAGRLT